jgi:transaldolase
MTTIQSIRQLRQMGQSLWLDNITRSMLTNGTLARYIRDFGLTGLTSNPTIFDHAIGGSDVYDESIRRKSREGKSGEDLFFELAIDDLAHAADLFRPIYDATEGTDGFASLEVSPLLANAATDSIAMAARLHAHAKRPNIFIKIPGTPEGNRAIEESLYAGVPINVTLLFSAEQYVASAQAYLSAIERRIAAGRDPRVASVASLFVSRWDVATQDKLPAELRNRLGIAVAMQTYRAYRELLAGPRWKKLAAAGALPQRLLWASTGTKDPSAPDTLYVEALAAPDTINTMPEKTLLAFADHGKVKQALPDDGGDFEPVLAACRSAGVDDALLAKRLQRDGADAFNRSWRALLQRIADKAHQLSGAT